MRYEFKIQLRAAYKRNTGNQMTHKCENVKGSLWNLAPNDTHAEVFRGEVYWWLQHTTEGIKKNVDGWRDGQTCEKANKEKY